MQKKTQIVYVLKILLACKLCVYLVFYYSHFRLSECGIVFVLFEKCLLLQKMVIAGLRRGGLW